jgi:hypothetical protein
MDSRDPMARVTFWNSGEVAFEVADIATGDILCNEHREVTSVLGIENSLQDAAVWTARRGAGSEVYHGRCR